ncbi:hypothetical protein [Acetobacter tropicalis]|uniref:hypothetical protein n=1 Tax=Acetobacter tropicalis TaxID=104102 RepID=UPI000B0D58EF|nr:hypothetical protein [Acetobacter tropicalis]
MKIKELFENKKDSGILFWIEAALYTISPIPAIQAARAPMVRYPASRIKSTMRSI